MNWICITKIHQQIQLQHNVLYTRIHKNQIIIKKETVPSHPIPFRQFHDKNHSKISRKQRKNCLQSFFCPFFRSPFSETFNLLRIEFHFDYGPRRQQSKRANKITKSVFLLLLRQVISPDEHNRKCICVLCIMAKVLYIIRPPFPFPFRYQDFKRDNGPELHIGFKVFESCDNNNSLFGKYDRNGEGMIERQVFGSATALK